MEADGYPGLRCVATESGTERRTDGQTDLEQVLSIIQLDRKEIPGWAIPRLMCIIRVVIGEQRDAVDLGQIQGCQEFGHLLVLSTRRIPRPNT